MKNEDIDESILEEVRDYIGCSDDVDEFNLAELLRNKRNEYHPDKYFNEDSKKTATDKFNKGTDLLKQLGAFLEKKKLLLPSTEVSQKKDLFEKESVYNQLELAKENIKSLETKIFLLKETISSLTKDLEERNSEELKDVKEKLIGEYKIGNKKIFKSSSFAILSGIIPFLTQIKKIKEFIEQYLIFSVSTINIIMTIICILVILLFVKEIIESKIINNKINDIISVPYIQKFLTTIDSSKFSDGDVYNYIQGTKCIGFKRFLGFIGFKLFKSETLNKLSKIFICNLLDRKLITLSKSEKLLDIFEISSNSYSRYY